MTVGEWDPDTLWDEFHRVVNMTSHELGDWLRTRSASPESEELPDQAGPPTGRRVLHILGKRKMDLDAEDWRVMAKVVERVRAARRGGEELEPTAGEEHWRWRLMSIGHDPLKPV